MTSISDAAHWRKQLIAPTPEMREHDKGFMFIQKLALVNR
jgi:hypothetical protein